MQVLDLDRIARRPEIGGQERRGAGDTAHDAVHVLFACDTSDRGEAVAHAWMLLGTTVTHREIREVTAGRDHRAFFVEVGHARRLRALLRALPEIAWTALRARRMRRRWPWTNYDRYLDVPLAEIRSEYGIQVPRPPARAG